MTKYNLTIRQVDRVIFDSIKNSQKTIETRAATDKYRKIKAGDILVFACGDEKLEKQIARVDYYKNIDEMTKAINFKSVMPFVGSTDEMEKVYFGFSGYKEKINKFGLVAFKLK